MLLVDDEEDSREAMRRILQQNGMLVTTASSAREAFELVERLEPDILLSDIAMPGEDGLSLIRRVRLLPLDRGGRIPAAAISAYAGIEDRRKSTAGRIPLPHSKTRGAGPPSRRHRRHGPKERRAEVGVDVLRKCVS